MTRISDLSQDLIEEILSRVPLTSKVSSTCKQWNSLYKDQSFTNKHRGEAADGTRVIMVRNSRVCLVSVKLEGVHNHKYGLGEVSTKLIGKLNRIKVSGEVYHCNGLLLCIPEYSRVKPNPVVLNPYSGQVRWIKPRSDIPDRYCIGYDNNQNHKILRILHHYDHTDGYEIYDFKSDSWKDLDFTSDWTIPSYHRGSSLKGNTYFVAWERLRVREYLICFDFTSERFRHSLDLESDYCDGDTVVLSAVREEQLAVLFHCVDTYEIEIRITTKIEEASEMTWRSFLKVDIKPFVERSWRFPTCGSFFVEEDKKVALLWDNFNYNKAYVIGEDNYFARVALGESQRWPVVCSYVPSSVQIQKVPVHARRNRKLRD